MVDEPYYKRYIYVHHSDRIDCGNNIPSGDENVHVDDCHELFKLRLLNRGIE